MISLAAWMPSSLRFFSICLERASAARSSADIAHPIAPHSDSNPMTPTGDRLLLLTAFRSPLPSPPPPPAAGDTRQVADVSSWLAVFLCCVLLSVDCLVRSSPSCFAVLAVNGTVHVTRHQSPGYSLTTHCRGRGVTRLRE